MHAFVAYVFASVHVNVRARARVGACARAHEKDVGLHVFARVCVCGCGIVGTATQRSSFYVARTQLGRCSCRQPTRGAMRCGH